MRAAARVAAAVTAVVLGAVVLGACDGGAATDAEPSAMATAGQVDLADPHLVVGARLDTVPQAPGAEDNASGVGALLAAAGGAGVAEVEPCADNRASDHWSSVRDGLPGVRLGSTPFAGYHSPDDVPSVGDAAHLERAAGITVAWLAGP